MMRHALILALALGAWSCTNAAVTRPAGASRLSLNLDMTAAPSEVARVRAVLSREGYASLDLELNVDGDLATGTFESVATGIWHLRVEALDGEDHVRYSGETDVYVLPGGTTNVDLTLSAASGSLVIHVHWPTGEAGQALRLNGETDFAEVMNSPSLQGLSSSLTLEAWIRPVEQYYNTVVCKGSKDYGVELAGYEYPGFLFQHLDINFSGAYDYYGRLVINGPLPAHTWSHIAVTLGQGLLKVYANGHLVYQTTFTGTLDPGDEALRIGARVDPNYTEYFQGDIDEVRVWNVARTAEEIQSSMKTELTGQEPGLVAYWNFNSLEESGAVPDESPNGNDALLMNGAHLVPSDAF